MTLSADEFIRRFLLHVLPKGFLPKGFHRFHHYGLLASAGCKTNIARARQLMAAPMAEVDPPAVHDTANRSLEGWPPLDRSASRDGGPVWVSRLAEITA